MNCEINNNKKKYETFILIDTYFLFLKLHVFIWTDNGIINYC